MMCFHATDCRADPDKDGHGNLEEFLNSTNPRMDG